MDWLIGATTQVERVFRAARQLAPDDDAAWDCVQEAFATALERAPVPDDPVAWLCGVARNHARHGVRARSRFATALARFAERAPRRYPPTTPDLHDALGGLPLRLRDAVRLRYLAGMSAAEVARAQGVSEAAAKARVRRGLARLRRLLGGAALATLLAREAAAAQGNAAALQQAAGRSTSASLVAPHWPAALLAILGVAGALLAWRISDETSRARGGEARTPFERMSGGGAAGAAQTRSEETASSDRHPADRPSVGFKGRVVDHLRRPVAGARVSIHADRGGTQPDWMIEEDRPVATTMLVADPKGEFGTDLPAGPYRIVARFRERSTQLRCVAGEIPGPIELVIPEQDQVRRVTVLDTQGAVVPGANVEILAGVVGEGVRTYHGTTDEAGTFGLQTPWIDNALVQARTRDGRTGWSGGWRLTDERSGAPLFVTVAAAGSLEGQLRGVERPLVEGAQLTAWALANGYSYESSFGVARTTTVADGRYRFDALAPGPYVLTLVAPRGVRLVTEPYILGGQQLGNSAAPVVAEVGAGGVSTRDLDVAQAAILEGVATCNDGTPVAEALVRATLVPAGHFSDGRLVDGVHVWRLEEHPEVHLDHPTTHWRTRTDTEGRYRLASLPPGLLRVEVFAAGLGFDRREEVVAVEGRTTHLAHRLAPGGVLQLALPSGGVGHLGLVPAGGDRPILRASPPLYGTLTLPSLPAGRYRVGAFSLDPSQGMKVDLGEVEIEAGRTTWLDLRHAGRYVLRGHVTDPAGPVAGLCVRSYGAGVVETDARGAFELRSIVRHPNGVSVEIGEGPFRQAFDFPVGDDELTVCEIVLGSHTLAVRAEDAAGEPAPVRLEVRSSLRGFRNARLSMDGEMQIRHLRPGVHGVTAYFASGAWVRGEATVPEDRHVVLREPPTGRLELTISGAVPGMLVEANACAPGKHLGRRTAWVGPDGRVVFASLPAGDIQLELQWTDRSTEENPIFYRLDSGESARFHRVPLGAGETLRLGLVVER